ncbi:zinc-dependent alcohol dehydrogenase family protein [Patulibacter minatonensis]|uniref:zinc-dependent alcohol dehydrogenase family protein n=1 Tax=Patulibacter minatonensis TaxID=298163 RepID=UPI0004BA9A6E|nr:NAD(P)-dependent alcohol dehydrogenase [Patulibacter minatonensis]
MTVAIARVGAPPTLESLVVETGEEPSVGPGQIKVRWRALSLNFHDYAVAAGLMPADGGRIPVSDGAGEVLEVGDGVTAWKPGDHVMSTFFPDWIDGEPTLETTTRVLGDSVDGCAAEVSVLPEGWVTRMPEGWSFQEAATLPCAGVSAWRALYDIADLQPGQSVLVQGSGGVSIFALQFAKATGATVYATTSSDEKAQKLRDLGADHVVNYRTDETWGDTVRDLTEGGVDLVVEVGGPDTIGQSIAACRYGGHIVLVGLLTGMDATIFLPALMYKQQRLRPLACASHAHQEQFVEFLSTVDVKPVIDRSFAFSEIGDALGHLVAGKHFGKITIDLEKD